MLAETVARDFAVPGLAQALTERGFAVVRQAVDIEVAREIRAQFALDDVFRSTVEMARHGFGSGVYRYYKYPLPSEIAQLRGDLYRALAPIANVWEERLGRAERYPPELDHLLAHCASTGQARCTVLQLRYLAGDYNALHRDLYGAIAFPLQATLLLDEPDVDFDGGEFVLVEQRPRKQSVANVLRPGLGDIVIFANDARPVRSSSGKWSTHRMRHGVSPLASGERHALGLIFHDST